MTTIYDECSKDELLQIVSEMQNDLNHAQNEIKLINKQIDNLIEENKQLKLRNKMLTKIDLNSIYGIHCCKNHCVYTDTDSKNDLQKQIDRHITDIVETSHKVIDDLKEENKKLQRCLSIAENDYKNCYAENIRLSEENNNLRRNIEYLCDENVRLRHELNEVKNNDINY